MKQQSRQVTGYGASEGMVTDLSNRRQSTRHAVAEDQAWIGWWEGRLYRKSPAVLVDISHGGTKLVAESAPPRRAPVWICVAGKNQTEWVEGSSVDVIRQSDGSAVVRVAFNEVCPYAFFEVVVYGFASGSNEADWSSESRFREGSF